MPVWVPLDDHYLAFLDIFPIAVGHVLVVPKNETDSIFDINDQEYMGLWQFAKKIAKAIEKTIPCKRVGIAVIGLEVPHAHIHLIPLQNVEDINFSKFAFFIRPHSTLCGKHILYIFNLLMKYICVLRPIVTLLPGML